MLIISLAEYGITRDEHACGVTLITLIEGGELAHCVWCHSLGGILGGIDEKEN